MVTITQQEDTALSYDNVEHDNGVSCSYDSMNSLIEDIKINCKGVLDALIMVNEVNYLNGYKLIGKFEIRKIKMHFREVHFSKYKVETVQTPFIEYEKSQIKVDRVQKQNVENKMKELQKGYMKLLSI